MSRLRAAFRMMPFLAWSMLMVVVHQLCWLLGLLSTQWLRRAQNGSCQLWARGVAAIVGLRVQTHGSAPRSPFILVSNHLGYLDIITLMSRAPGVFVSRADLARWPVLGLMARTANTIFIDRKRRSDVARVNGLIHNVLASGRGVLIFPEGTSSDGSEVLPFRSSLLQVAVASGQAVSYASLSYTTPEGSPPASEAVCWWGEMTFLKHFIQLLGLSHIEAKLTFGSERIQAESRHELATRLHRAVSEQLQSTASGSISWA